MKKFIGILASFSIMFFMAATSSAQILNPAAQGAIQNNAALVQGSAGLGQASVGTIIAMIIRAGLGLLAAIFLVLMVFAGFQWMTASGNEQQIEKAQNTIKTAIIGLIIVLAAYAITYFIFKFLPFSGAAPASGLNGENGGLTTSP